MLLTSCTREEVQEVGSVMTFRLASDSTSIVQKDSTEITRTVDGVNDNSTFIFPADFTVAVDGENHVYTANSANTNMISLAPASYPVTGNSVRVLAFYPSFKMRYNATPQTFTVAQDQSQTGMGTSNYMVSDLMYGLPKPDFAYLDGTGKVLPSNDPVPLVFEHKMVKIRIDVTTNGANVKQIKMKNVKRSIKFNTSDATFSGLASADDGLGDVVIMYDNVTGTSTYFTCTALIPQQNLAASTQFIDVVIEAQPSDLTLTYSLHDATNFVSGKQYIYNLAVSMDKLEVSCSIADWNTSPAGWSNVNEILTL